MITEIKKIGFFCFLALSAQTYVLASEPVMPVNTMPEVVVTAEKDIKAASPLADVQGAKIYSGKKTTSVQMSGQPQVQNNNYRQAFSQLPGLLVSEQNNHGHVNINYRGIGDPHESQDLLTLKDGLPIGMERYGYSTTYYVPPFEAVDQIELIRGGSALLYGPQPGPVLNYLTNIPPADKEFILGSGHVFGSNNFYSTYNHIGGTVNRVGYLGYFNHSQSEGRRDNEDFEINGGSFKFVLDSDSDSRWTWNLDVQEKESGEPGRLALAQYQADRFQTIRPFDKLETSRFAADFGYERDFSEDTLWKTKLHGSYFDRFSLRRTSNTSNQNNLDRREVYAGGLETSILHKYEAFKQKDKHVLVAGFMAYGSDAPRSQDRSAAYPSNDGTPIFDFDYHTYSGAFFAENQFRLGDLSVIPAFRLEFIDMSAQENFNTGKTSALHDINETYTVPLAGLGLEHPIGLSNEIYANISQGFKPPQFDTLAPTGNNTLPATNLDEGNTWTYEAGLRGNPLPWFQYDASVFLTDYKNYFGTVTVGGLTQQQNVGDVQYDGVDLSLEADLVSWLDGQRSSPDKLSDRIGSLSVYFNASFLSAEFEGGPLTGKEPAFAPSYVIKTGLIYRLPDKLGKISLLSTFVEEHYWADNNQAGTTGLNSIPDYEVLDLTSEFNVYKDSVKLFFSISNLTDEVYFSRVRSDGIEPADERSYQAGVKVLWG